MTDFEDFLRDLDMLVDDHKKNGLALKLKLSAKDNIVHIFGEYAIPLARARQGLDHVLELAGATAEHHPFWDMLDHSAEISSTILDRWQDELSESELDEIAWHIQSLSVSLEKIKQAHH